MRLKVEQLVSALKKGLAPVYFITGDEPLQQNEAADLVRKAARQAGFDNREVFTVDAHFQWGELSASADSLSIFADKKIIELRMPGGKPGTEGSKTLLSYCERPPEDTVMIVTAGKLESGALKSKWFQGLERAGVVIQVWPLTGSDLIGWLQARMQQRGLSVQSEGLKILAARVEGNLLAAAQEIEKLYVLYGPKKLSVDDIQNVVADSSRYDVFNLSDCILAGKTARTLKILNGLQAEGVAEPIVLWALTREIRLLLQIKAALGLGQAMERVLNDYRIWDKRKNLVKQCLDRLSSAQLNQALLMCSRVDRQIKGAEKGSSWESLLMIALMLAGADVMAGRV